MVKLPGEALSCLVAKALGVARHGHALHSSDPEGGTGGLRGGLLLALPLPHKSVCPQPQASDISAVRQIQGFYFQGWGIGGHRVGGSYLHRLALVPTACASLKTPETSFPGLNLPGASPAALPEDSGCNGDGHPKNMETQEMTMFLKNQSSSKQVTEELV